MWDCYWPYIRIGLNVVLLLALYKDRTQYLISTGLRTQCGIVTTLRTQYEISTGLGTQCGIVTVVNHSSGPWLEIASDMGRVRRQLRIATYISNLVGHSLGIATDLGSYT